MKRLLLTLMAALPCLSLSAQSLPDSLRNIEDRVKPVVFTCPQITANCAALYRRYMQEEQIDSVRLLLHYWEAKCGRSEPVQRAITLFAISNGSYSNAVLSSHILMDIAAYKAQVKATDAKQPNYWNYYADGTKAREFDRFTRELAGTMRDRFEPGSMEYLWCDFYGPNPDSVFHNIRSTAYDSTEIRSIYDKEVVDNRKELRWNTALLAGAWIPTGSLSRLGTHAELGLQAGGRNSRWGMDLTFIVRFLRSPQPYEALRSSNNVQLTRYFLGGYFGLDAFYDLAHIHKNLSLSALAGGGVDWINPFEQNTKNKDDNIKAATSYNFNLGLGVRRTFADSWYVGMQLKYNFTDYTLNNIIAYPGNTITVRMVVGGTIFNDGGRQYRAEALEL